MNNNYTKFTNEQIVALGTTNEGLELVIENCTALIYDIASGVYIGEYELEDKLQIGRMGLVKAVQKFDLEKANASGNDFYTFANKVIRNYLYQDASKFKAAKRGYNKEEGTSIKVYSLEYTTESEGSEAAINYIVDESVNVHKAATEDQWGWMLQFMTRREYECVCLYFRNQETLEEIANRYGSSRQAASKVLRKAIDKLKNRYTVEKLTEMIELR